MLRKKWCVCDLKLALALTAKYAMTATQSLHY